MFTQVEGWYGEGRKMGEEGEVPLWSCLYHCPGLHLWALWWKGALSPQPRGCVRHGVRHEASLHHDATPASPMDVRKLCDHIINLHSLKAQWFAWNTSFSSEPSSLPLSTVLLRRKTLSVLVRRHWFCRSILTKTWEKISTMIYSSS